MRGVCARWFSVVGERESGAGQSLKPRACLLPGNLEGICREGASRMQPSIMQRVRGFVCRCTNVSEVGGCFRRARLSCECTVRSGNLGFARTWVSRDPGRGPQKHQFAPAESVHLHEESLHSLHGARMHSGCTWCSKCPVPLLNGHGKAKSGRGGRCLLPTREMDAARCTRRSRMGMALRIGFRVHERRQVNRSTHDIREG